MDEGLSILGEEEARMYIGSEWSDGNESIYFLIVGNVKIEDLYIGWVIVVTQSDSCRGSVWLNYFLHVFFLNYFN